MSIDLTTDNFTSSVEVFTCYIRGSIPEKIDNLFMKLRVFDANGELLYEKCSYSMDEYFFATSIYRDTKNDMILTCPLTKMLVRCKLEKFFGKPLSEVPPLLVSKKNRH